MNQDKTYQFISCPFLVLREHLSLPTILLGNQFLYQTNSNLTYNDVGLVTVQIYYKYKYKYKYKYVENLQTCNADEVYFTKLRTPSTTEHHSTHPSCAGHVLFK
jgi:hypothetical protein